MHDFYSQFEGEEVHHQMLQWQGGDSVKGPSEQDLDGGEGWKDVEEGRGTGKDS